MALEHLRQARSPSQATLSLEPTMSEKNRGEDPLGLGFLPTAAFPKVSEEALDLSEEAFGIAR